MKLNYKAVGIGMVVGIMGTMIAGVIYPTESAPQDFVVIGLTNYRKKGSEVMPGKSWWKGEKGEWYVVVQGLLFVLVAFGPRSWPGWPAWVFPFTTIGSATGVVLLAGGGLLILAGFLKLGVNLTALPFPKDHARLQETGPYGIVRHPIYGGGVFVAVGWALWIHGWLTLGYAGMLFAFLDIKSRREEQWLKEKFPAYPAYQNRVRKLIPFIY